MSAGTLNPGRSLLSSQDQPEIESSSSLYRKTIIVIPAINNELTYFFSQLFEDSDVRHCNSVTLSSDLCPLVRPAMQMNKCNIFLPIQ